MSLSFLSLEAHASRFQIGDGVAVVSQDKAAVALLNLDFDFVVVAIQEGSRNLTASLQLIDPEPLLEPTDVLRNQSLNSLFLILIKGREDRAQKADDVLLKDWI